VLIVTDVNCAAGGKNMSKVNPPFRADQVGSLLRPKELLDARQRYQRNEISKAERLKTVYPRGDGEENIGLRASPMAVFFHTDFGNASRESSQRRETSSPQKSRGLRRRVSASLKLRRVEDIRSRLNF
jgi:hypothetical protein